MLHLSLSLFCVNTISLSLSLICFFFYELKQKLNHYQSAWIIKTIKLETRAQMENCAHFPTSIPPPFQTTRSCFLRRFLLPISYAPYPFSVRPSFLPHIITIHILLLHSLIHLLYRLD